MGQCTLYYPGTQYIYVRIYQVTLLAHASCEMSKHKSEIESSDANQ